MKVSSFVSSTLRSVLFATSLLAGTISLAGVASAGDKLPFDNGVTLPVTSGYENSNHNNSAQYCIPNSSQRYAVDFAPASGNPNNVSSRVMREGKVIQASFNPSGYAGFGNVVVIQTALGLDVYAHHENIDQAMIDAKNNGTTVTQGMRVGKIGSTGVSSGTHLHVERFETYCTKSIKIDFDEDLNDTVVNDSLTSQNSGVVSTAQSTRSSGDFNGDGVSDILWRNTISGDNDIWYFGKDGRVFTSIRHVNIAESSGWKVQVTGDFNGDSVSDIFWHNSQTGDNDIWYFGKDGRVFITIRHTGILDNTGWKIVSTGDFNGDGVYDILWRNTISGDNDIGYFGKDGRVFTSIRHTNIPESSGWKVAPF
jgi:hypothetical protein